MQKSLIWQLFGWFFSKKKRRPQTLFALNIILGLIGWLDLHSITQQICWNGLCSRICEILTWEVLWEINSWKLGVSFRNPHKKNELNWITIIARQSGWIGVITNLIYRYGLDVISLSYNVLRRIRSRSWKIIAAFSCLIWSWGSCFS